MKKRTASSPPTPDENPNYCLPPAPLPDTPETRADMARFKTSARILDQKMGVVLRALERSGLAERTLVICTTDHGIAFPRMKCTLTDSGIGVMLIVRGPSGFAGGEVIDAMVIHLDLFPTICELAGIEPPARLQGASLLPLINGDVERFTRRSSRKSNYHASYEPQRCVRTNRWKYIRRYDERARPVLANCDDGPSKDVWTGLTAGASMPPVEEALYDLVFDPNESANLVSNPGHAAVLGEMRMRLEAWMRQTDDPLLRYGFVPAPKTAIDNDPDDLSPNGLIHRRHYP